MDEPLFRKSSLERLHSPEQLDQLLVIIKPKDWLAIFTIVLLLVGIVIWSTTAKIPVQIGLRGIINTPDKFFTIRAMDEGSIVEVKVKKGEWIEAGQPLFVLVEPKDGLKTVYSPISGVVFLLDVNLQDYVTRGANLLCVSQALKKDQQLRAYAYIPINLKGQVNVGMSADVQWLGHFLDAVVADVSAYSLSETEILEGVPSKKWLKYLNPTQEPVLEVIIAFDLLSPQTKENLPLLEPGDPCSIRITTAEKKPITFLIP